jgi:hypothetical protein
MLNSDGDGDDTGIVINIVVMRVVPDVRGRSRRACTLQTCGYELFNRRHSRHLKIFTYSTVPSDMNSIFSIVAVS